MLHYYNHREKVHVHYFGSIMALDPKVLSVDLISKGMILGRMPEKIMNCPFMFKMTFGKKILLVPNPKSVSKLSAKKTTDGI